MINKYIAILLLVFVAPRAFGESILFECKSPDWVKESQPRDLEIDLTNEFMKLDDTDYFRIKSITDKYMTGVDEHRKVGAGVFVLNRTDGQFEYSDMAIWYSEEEIDKEMKTGSWSGGTLSTSIIKGQCSKQIL